MRGNACAPLCAATRRLLAELAAKYENDAFADGDPSLFLHRVTGGENVETMAFIASALSYGSRAQFLPKIEAIRLMAGGKVHEWVKSGAYAGDFAEDDARSFYRLYSFGKMRRFLDALRDMLAVHGTIGGFVRAGASDGYSAVCALTGFFSKYAIDPIVPKDPKSACKRVCLFLRWMVRDGSPVDTGLWKDFIDKRTLVIPLDTHVLRQANELGLVSSSCASMRTARAITAKLAEVFPDDPLKGDFALFGLGVSKAER